MNEVELVKVEKEIIVDVGFWDKDGNYQEDYQSVRKDEIYEYEEDKR